VVAIGLFTPRNPLPEVLRVELGPRAGRAVVATRMRLATSQPVLAVARLSDGSCWSHAVEVEVTLAACTE
jgi:sulfur-oxidizing protein SoxY